MSLQQSYRQLVSGQKSGLLASLVRSLFAVAACFDSVAVRVRNLLYSKALLKTYRADAVVFSVGNITVGGTGKTPLVIWLYNQIIENFKFQIANYECVILTRGYRGTQNSKLKTQNYTDEPAILTQRCPRAEVIVNPDRVAGANEAVNRFGAKVLIMDDGFQHRRLARDLDIVTIDATLPFGYGKVLPAGLLREPMTALRRANAAIITRCDQTSEPELAQIERKLRSIKPGMVIARSIHAPVCARSADDEALSLQELQTKSVYAFCGLGNPDAFLNTVRGLCTELVGSSIYDDHHHYMGNEIADIYQEARRLKADLILTTEKDWTKINLRESGLRNSEFKPQLAYCVIELKFLVGEDKLTALIEDALEGKIRKDV